MFPGLSLPVVLQRSPHVADGLQKILRGWEPVIRHTSDDGVSALARATRKGDGFEIHSIFLDEPMAGLSAASAVCGIVADLSQAYVEERSGFIGLHCGAFMLNGILIAIAGPARSGKSTLISRLTMEVGIRILCDDVLPVSPEGIAHGLGIAPRLRLPLPGDASAAFRSHVGQHMVLKDRRYGYIVSPSLAPHGTRAALSILVVLSRDAASEATLHRLDSVDAVHHLLMRNVAEIESARAFETATALAGHLACFQLNYSDLETAVALLHQAFGGDDVVLEKAISRTPPRAAPLPTGEDSLADLKSLWHRHPNVSTRRISGQVFLWHLEHGTPFHLNEVAAAVWSLLEAPITGDEIAALLSEAFPSEPEARIARDLGRLLAGLEAEQLIEMPRPEFATGIMRAPLPPPYA
jgi:hypothetical protein